MRSGVSGLLKRNKSLRLAVVCVAFLISTACSNQPASQPTPTPSPTVAAAQTSLYQAVGVVKSLNRARPGIEIEHEEIVGLMQGMQMEFPVTDGAMLNGIAVNDRVDFTIDNATGEMKIVAIKKK